MKNLQFVHWEDIYKGQNQYEEDLLKLLTIFDMWYPY